MGLIAAVFVGIIGFVITFLVDLLPMKTIIKIMPICWIPGVDCTKSYNTFKTYMIIVLICIIIGVIPIRM
uniref:Uncharacterized protein n=1 Tax=viral metagenome TaxID=1070528 RepID=A0A6C0LSA6_9ZZZZ